MDVGDWPREQRKRCNYAYFADPRRGGPAAEAGDRAPDPAVVSRGRAGPRSQFPNATLATKAAQGSVNPPRLHAPRDARTRLWFLFSSYLSAPERLRKPNRTPSPRPGPSHRSRAPARPTLPVRTPPRSSARFCPRFQSQRTLFLLPYLRQYSASSRVVPNSGPGSSAEPRGETFSPRSAAARSSPAASPPGRQLPVWVRGKRVPFPVPSGPQRIWSVSVAEGEDGSTSGRPPQRRGRPAGCRSRSFCCGDDWGRGRWLQSPPSSLTVRKLGLARRAGSSLGSWGCGLLKAACVSSSMAVGFPRSKCLREVEPAPEATPSLVAQMPDLMRELVPVPSYVSQPGCLECTPWRPLPQ
ncbi:translation initiation factor IF-2-like [Pteropus medius]|uniref:translation initiation factor IF-2-like n=1 Tax=Pteropus vampyrus TaxID=132908 RepID=UPI00196A2018|nr:translation initiation factor IF-2-like [Pteropus giganteus]